MQRSASHAVAFSRVHISIALIAALLAAPDSAAQLSDLQPGHNFPAAVAAFGTGRSENIDVGDVDEDGDYDVVVANGGEGAAQANVIYINNGNLQGGVPGTFTDETAARFLGVPNDTSQDIELVDLDGDFDLDVFVANRGTTVNGGEVSRVYINQGGLQHGNVGTFLEETDAFWGTLVGVPLSQEDGVQDGQGPWRDFSCDCDFGDLDADGDLDLFNSSYGPNFTGNTDSRIFLNVGNARFDELWPWADASADTKLLTLDIDLADFDGDFDLDIVASGRDSQARIYRNNLSDRGWAADPFTDATQTALLATGAAVIGPSNYETEFGDMDSDGDFDLWMVDYDDFSDVLLRNDGGLMFSKTSWNKGDPSVDDSECDFLDYDGDGDLDAFIATFSGTSRIYQSSLADGVPEAQGLLHRTGTPLGGSLAPWVETPFANNVGQHLDGECADMDGDGDTDILVCKGANQGNRYWENALGVPDTHAPHFQQITVQGDKADGSDTVIQAQVRDNASAYIVAFYTTSLIYSVDGGPATCVPMSSMGGMQFRGLIPGGIDGSVAYRVECTDDAGNTGVSGTTVYLQASSGTPLWQNLGCGTLGVHGIPKLSLSGSQIGGSPVALSLVDTAFGAPCLLWLAFAPTPLNAIGGTVYALPFNVQVPAFTDAGGMLFASTTWPLGMPPGTEATWQAVIADGNSVHGLVLSNAVKSISP